MSADSNGLNPKIKDAILIAAREAGQSEELAEVIFSWFELIASGNEDVQNEQSSKQNLKRLYDKTRPLSEEIP